MAEKAVEEKIPWIAIIVTVVIISFIGPIWQMLISAFPNWIVNSLGVSLCSIGMGTAPFLVILLSAPFFWRMKKQSLALLGFLYIASIIPTYMINYPWALGHRYLFASRYMEQDLADKIVPWFMSPSADVCRVMATGGPVNWTLWSVPIAWWWAMNVLTGLFFIITATIFRRLWIDIEKVPFPQTIIVYHLAQNVESRFKSKYFLAGMLLGLAFQIPVTLKGLFPWFPDVYGVTVNTCAHLTRFITPSDPLGGLPGMMGINYNPALVAIAYLNPLSILFSTWFFALVYMVTVQIAWYMGYYTGITDIGTCGRYWCHPSPAADPPIKFNALCIGAILMLAISHLILNRQYLMSTLKQSTQQLKESSEESISYKTLYLSLAVIFVALIVFWILSSLSLIEALIYPFATFFLFFPAARIFGLAGAYPGAYGHGFLFYRLLYPEASSPPTTQQWIIAHFHHPYNGGDSTYSWGSVAFTSFASYKMASLCGITEKKAFTVMIVVLILAPLISLVSFIWTVHTLGGMHISIWKSWFEGIGERFHLIPDWWKMYPATEPWIGHVLVGAIIGGGLSFLHAKFIWFPLSPIGFLLGFSGASLLFGFWIPFFVAWVLKVITLRLGGAKLYENYGVPIASGAVTGTMIGVIFGGILWIIRYFIPF